MIDKQTLTLGLLGYSLLLTSMSSQAVTLSKQDQQQFNVEIITDKLSAPWGVDQLPEQPLLIVTEKSGGLKVFDIEKNTLSNVVSPLQKTPLDSLVTWGQGGLMDVAVSPDFKESQVVFFTYAKQLKKGAFATTLASATLMLKNKQWQLNHWRDLLVTQPASDSRKHFGSRIAFDNSGHVYFSVGDRGNRDNGQDLSSHAGSILRINRDGSVPLDNPFYNVKNAKKEIYSFGHRNPQGLYFDQSRARLFSAEHGPRGGDEINLIQAGANYGWPVVSYGKEYWGPVSVGEGTQKLGMVSPLMQYTPSIAPSSLLLYKHSYFEQFKDNFLLGALALQHVNQVSFAADLTSFQNKRQLMSLKRRIRDVLSLPDGQLVLLTDRGEMLKVSKAE